MVTVNSLLSWEIMNTPPSKARRASPKASIDSISLLLAERDRDVQVVGRLIEKEHVRVTQGDLSEGDTGLLTSGQILDLDGVGVTLQTVTAQEASY